MYFEPGLNRLRKVSWVGSQVHYLLLQLLHKRLKLAESRRELFLLLKNPFLDLSLLSLKKFFALLDYFLQLIHVDVDFGVVGTLQLFVYALVLFDKNLHVGFLGLNFFVEILDLLLVAELVQLELHLEALVLVDKLVEILLVFAGQLFEVLNQLKEIGSLAALNAVLDEVVELHDEPLQFLYCLVLFLEGDFLV